MNTVDVPNVNELAYARGIGYGYGYGPGHGSFSSPSSNTVRINRNAEITKSENQCNRELFGQVFGSVQRSFEDSTRASQFNGLCDRISELDSRNTDGQFRAELRSSDRADLFRVESRLDKLAECCCDQKVAAAEAETRNVERFCELKAGQATITAKLDHNKEVAELNAELTALKTQVACGCTTGCSRPCHHHGHHGRG